MDLHYNNQSLAALKLLNEIEQVYNSLSKPIILNCYIAGGIAVNFYTGQRATADLDLEFDKRIVLPKLSVEFENQKIYLDTNYTSSLGLIYADYKNDAIEITQYQPTDSTIKIKPYLFSPEDLVISKLSRWGENDQKDVQRLIDLKLVDKDLLNEKIEDALIDYIGYDKFLKCNIKEMNEMFPNGKILRASPSYKNGC